jgi:hypothetical protein
LSDDGEVTVNTSLLNPLKLEVDPTATTTTTTTTNNNGPEVDVNLPKADIDISGPKVDIDAPDIPDDENNNRYVIEGVTYEEDENGTYYVTTDEKAVPIASVTLDDSNYQNYKGGTINATYSALKYTNLPSTKDGSSYVPYVEYEYGNYYLTTDGIAVLVELVTLDESNYQNYVGGTRNVISYSASKYTQVANNTDGDVGVKTQSPATGDSFAAAPLIAAAIVSLGTAAGAMVYIKKRKSAKNAE